MHYYKFEISVWNLHTAHLTLVEEAVYRRLIDHYYDTEAPIGNDYAAMIRRLRLEKYEAEVITILNEFFVDTGEGWRNKHCDEKIKLYKKKKKTNKINGQSGGRPKKQTITEEEPTRLPFVTLTTNNKQETKNKDISNDRFDEFYKVYPKKVAKEQAIKAWRKIKPNDELFDKIIKSIKSQGLADRDKQFVPNPATWLNGKRWEDEVAVKQNDFDMMLRRAK